MVRQQGGFRRLRITLATISHRLVSSRAYSLAGDGDLDAIFGQDTGTYGPANPQWQEKDVHTNVGGGAWTSAASSPIISQLASIRSNGVAFGDYDNGAAPPPSV